MRLDRIDGGMVSWQHRAEQAECELRSVKRASRLSHAINSILRQTSDEAGALGHVCQALVDAGCHAAAWVVPGKPTVLRTLPHADVDLAKLESWFRSWGAMEAEFAGAATPLAGLFGMAEASRVLPLRDDCHFFGAIAVALDEGPVWDDALEAAVFSLAFAVATWRARAELLRHEADRQQRDGLTGLANRDVLVAAVGQALARARCGRGGLALGVLNLDGLKLINYSLGHEAGDALLAAVAQRLLGVVRDRDTVARLGGDEFAILFAETPCSDAVAALGNEMLGCFASPFAVGEHELHLSACLGVAVYPDDGDSTAALLQHAHSALHSAKQEGGASWRFYNSSMGADDAERIRLDQALRGAVERGEFELHYQPQIDLRSGCIVGLEALVRWHHPELGLISPARFIPLAEQTGLIVSLGEWVMRGACVQMVAWQKAGLAPRRIAVNVSARQFWQGDMAERVARLLRETGIPAGALELEITESVVMRDIAETVQVLSTLRTLGLTLSLDDFGTGYSSLSYLRSLPINKLKIDRTFVHDVTTNADVALLVQQIISIGHAFKLGVVAEGVETRESVDFLARSGCDEVQGFYFGKPLPAQEMEVLLLQNHCHPWLPIIEP